MRTIARASASDSLGDDFVGLVRRGGAAVGVHFRAILPQFFCDFPPPLVWDPGGLEDVDADCLVFQDPTTQQPFNEQLLVRREISGSVNHDGNPIPL
jgi:hypothetical protein